MSVQVLFDEAGEFKLGTILEERDATLQVEAASGRRAKVKTANVLLRFGGESLSDLLQRAEAIASDIDASFLWEVSAGSEFVFTDLAADYFGHKPSALEAIGVAVKLHGSPMHFYKRGKGRYQAAPEENLKAALASVEKKKRQQAQIEAWVEQLKAKQLPDGWLSQIDKLLFKPDRNTLEVKAVEGACEALGADMGPARLLGEAGAFTSAEAFHLRQFMHEHFANGVHQPPEPYRIPEEITLTGEWPMIDVASLPVVEVKTFSIDDEATTEIDDAFSLTHKGNGTTELGIHIAAPALFMTPTSEGEVIARRHLSTVYYPSGKVTMLPESLVQSATLKAGQRVPVLSLYLSLDTTNLNVTSTRTVLEQLTITDNLRLDALEVYFNDETVAANAVQGAYSEELLFLHRFASQLKVARGAANQNDRQDYSFRVTGDLVSITPRLRGGAIDTVVSELMILANSTWGGWLKEKGAAGIYRNQVNNRTRMDTVAGEHEGLGVKCYAWSSSPIRRYVDLVNQRQLIALAHGFTPPYTAKSLAPVVREFEMAYDAYNEFQRTLERYWCMRWMQQENHFEFTASVLREDLIRLHDLPIYTKVVGMPTFGSGTHIRVAFTQIDLWKIEYSCRYLDKDRSP